MFDTAWLVAFDSTVGGFLHALRTPALTGFFYGCTLLANTGTIVALMAVVVLGLAARRRLAEALFVLAVVAGGEAISVTVKFTLARVRPAASNELITLPGDPAFPSGHAIAALLLYGAIAFLLARAAHTRGARVAIAAVGAAVILLVGLSRVYLGVHWPSDVVGAWMIGGAWLAACAFAYRRWRASHCA